MVRVTSVAGVTGLVGMTGIARVTGVAMLYSDNPRCADHSACGLAQRIVMLSTPATVIPAKAGIQACPHKPRSALLKSLLSARVKLDPSFRWDDGPG